MSVTRDELLRRFGKDVRALSRLEPWKALGAIALDYAVIAAAWIAAAHSTNPAVWAVAAVLVATRQMALLILMHDAAHQRLLASRRWNDAVSDVFLAWPLLVTTSGYRSGHLKHHRFLNTEQDPDFASRLGREEWAFPKRPRAFVRLFLGLLAGGGLVYIVTSIARYSRLPENQASLRDPRTAALRLLHLAVLGAFVAGLGLGWHLVLLWLVPAYVILPVLSRLRSIAEHSGLPRTHDLDHSRNYHGSWLTEFFLVPHEANYHLDHHVFPAVPFYNLPRLNRLLATDAGYARFAHTNEGILSTRGTGLLADLVTARPHGSASRSPSVPLPGASALVGANPDSTGKVVATSATTLERVRHGLERVRHPLERVRHPLERVRHPLERIRHTLEQMHHALGRFTPRNDSRREATTCIADQRGREESAPSPAPPAPPATPATPADAPGPRPKGILGALVGHVAEFRADPSGFYTRLMLEHGCVVRLRYGLTPAFLVSSPAAVKHVLVDRCANYPKRTPAYDRLRRLLGQGTLTADGESWRRSRRLVQPAFRKDRHEDFARLMHAEAGEVAARFREHARSGEPIDVSREMTRAALTIVARALFGADASGESSVVHEALSVALRELHARITRPIETPRWLPTRANVRFVRALAALDGVVYRMIGERRRRPGSGSVLDHLLAARDDETGEALGDEQVRDEVMTLVLAGHETTAMALSWTWRALSDHPDVERRLHDEVARAPLDLRGAPLDYTTAVFQETLRLYPPIWSFGRRALADDTIEGFRVPAGSLVIVSPWVVHRNPRVWPEPERFDPERFLPEPEREREGFIAFGAGQRLCPGRGFALLEARILLATLAREFRLELLDDGPVRAEPLITLRPSRPLRARVLSRAGR